MEHPKSKMFKSSIASTFTIPTVSIDTYSCTRCFNKQEIILGETTIICNNCNNNEFCRTMPQIRTYLAQ